MTQRHDLHHDHRILTITHWMMALVAAGLLWTMVSMLTGAPDVMATPVGLAGLVISVAAMWFAGSKLQDKADGGPRLAFWGSKIRIMGTINIIVSLILIALPRLP